MAQDPYSVLGVGRTATSDEIRKAYRALAKKYHPDRNPGDKAAEDRFKAVSAAFDIVGDDVKRRKFDGGELDADGNERPTMRKGPFSGATKGWGPQSGGERTHSDEVNDIFAEFFGKSAGARRAPKAARGQDIRYRLAVSFLDAARGATKRVVLNDERDVDIAIPEGLRDGQTLRLKGKGMPGRNGGPAGDVLVEVAVKPHPVFQIKDNDLTLDVPITLREAVVGGKIEIPILAGTVAIKVPPNTSSGVSFRLRGKGLKDPKTGEYGDLLARAKIILPSQPDAALHAFVEGWQAEEGDPRAALKAAAER